MTRVLRNSAEVAINSVLRWPGGERIEKTEYCVAHCLPADLKFIVDTP